MFFFCFFYSPPPFILAFDFIGCFYFFFIFLFLFLILINLIMNFILKKNCAFLLLVVVWCFCIYMFVYMCVFLCVCVCLWIYICIMWVFMCVYQFAIPGLLSVIKYIWHDEPPLALLKNTLSFRSHKNLRRWAFLCIKTPSKWPVSTERI